MMMKMLMLMMMVVLVMVLVKFRNGCSGRGRLRRKHGDVISAAPLPPNLKVGIGKIFISCAMAREHWQH